MKLHTCGSCSSPIYFENDVCLCCGSVVGYDAILGKLRSHHRAANGDLAPEDDRDAGTWVYCSNHDRYGVCNWVVPKGDPTGLCISCRLNRTIPDLSNASNLLKWSKIEFAKSRLVAALLEYGLPVISKSEDAQRGLAFDFLENPPGSQVDQSKRVLTGHEDGVITLNIEEADDALREAAREQMGEPYRTLLGHFRHESGHYYWDLLIRDDAARLHAFRQLFGDERVDYATALQHHYQNGPGDDWQEKHVTSYAASHPWEDWAETWAHYFHITDTLETAAAHGLSVGNEAHRFYVTGNRSMPIKEIGMEWHEVRTLLNNMNRSMGLPDAYPFVLSDTILQKLSFVSDVCHAAG